MQFEVEIILKQYNQNRILSKYRLEKEIGKVDENIHNNASFKMSLKVPKIILFFYTNELFSGYQPHDFKVICYVLKTVLLLDLEASS